MMPKKDHERDVELDKKIEALRRKNEALMRRHKEVEEDRKRAEEEGMALQSRKGKAEDLTITISKSTSDARVVVTKPFGGDSKKGQQEAAGPNKVGDVPAQAAARGHRKQLTVTMAGKKGKRVVSERSERGPCPSDVQSPAGDGQVWRAEPAPTTARHAAEKDGVKPVQQHTEDHHRLSEQGQEAERLQASTDLDVPTSKEEQGEYARWKKERQQIDRERVARHKNAKGQWKRAWDMDKTENTSLDKSLPDRDWGALGRGGRSSRRGQSRAGHEKRGRDEGGRDEGGRDEGGRDEGGRDVLVMSSKAKGIDRLTGRARSEKVIVLINEANKRISKEIQLMRWQEIEDGANLQSLDTTLEEFLEALGALTVGEADNQKEGAKLKPSNSPDSLSASEEVIEPTAATQRKGSGPGPPGSERKVRFSTGHKQHGAGPRDAESRSVESFEANKQQHRVQRPRRRAETAGGEDVSAEDPGGGPSASGGDNGGSPPSAGPRSSAKPSPARPVGLAKCNANAGELIDSGLSVLVLDSGETHPTHSAGNDKAREHGKIV